MSNHPPDFVAIDRAGIEILLSSNFDSRYYHGEKLCKSTAAVQICKNTAYGISEGATLAPFAAVQCDDIAGLLLAGFSYGNMRDTLNWQLSGGSSMD